MAEPLRNLSTANPAGFRDVEAHTARPHLDRVRVIDVREPYEFAEAHIPNAELVPLATVPQVAGRWAKDQTLVVVCRSGGRSARAAAWLAQAGFREVYNLSGGMMNWQAQRLPALTGTARAAVGV